MEFRRDLEDERIAYHKRVIYQIKQARKLERRYRKRRHANPNFCYPPGKLGFASITLGVTIVDRISIGENTVVGSGSLVLKDLPDNVLAYGNPAVIVRSREAKERFLK